MPHKYVTRGSKAVKIGMGEANITEYLHAIGLLIKDTELPKSDKSYIKAHQTELIRLSNKWDWHTCRTWSEEVFSGVADKTIKDGWSNHVCIKDMQRDICMENTRH